MNSPIQFNKKARPVFLPGRNDQGSATYVASGWGCIRSLICSETSVSDFANQLQAVKIPFVPKEDCKKAWADKTKITDRMLCAGEIDTKYPAMGDSGGKTFL